MAITVITGGTQNGGVTNGNDVTLTFPTLSQNDVVYVAAGRGNGGPSLNTAGYTQVATQTATNGTHILTVWRKVMGATPDTSVVIEGGANTQTATSAVCVCLSGVDTTTPEDVTPTTTNGNSTNPDCPSIGPFSDSGVLLIAFASSQIIDTTTSAPSGWSNHLSIGINDTQQSTTARATNAPGATSAVDPPAFGTWSTGSWAAISVAVRPAGSSSSYTFSVSGGVTMGGTADQLQGKVFAPSGGTAITGTVPFLKTEVYGAGGSVAFSGTAALSSTKEYTVSPSGAVIFSGAAPQIRGDVFSVSGSVVMSGTATQIHDRGFSAGGSVVMTGSALLLKTRLQTATGSVLFSGSAGITSGAGAQSYTFTNGGTFTMSGEGSYTKTDVLSVGGSFTMSGTFQPIHSHTYEVSGGTVIAGTNPLLKTHIQLPSGAVAFTGTNTLIFTAAGGPNISTRLPMTGVGP